MTHPPPWQLRTGVPADAAALAALGRRMFAEAHREAFSPADLEAVLDRDWSEAKLSAEFAAQGTVFFVAEVDGAPQGLVAMRPGAVPGRESRNPVEFCRFYLYSEWIGKGMGSALIGAALDWYRSSSHDACWLSTWERNHRAIGAYRARGFADIGWFLYTVGGSSPVARVMLLDAGPALS